MPNSTYRRKIGVDCDGVIINIQSVWTYLYNTDWNDNLRPEQITDWDMTKFVKKECGDKIYQYLKNKALYDFSPLYPGAIEALEKLRKKWKLVFITHTVPGQEGRKLKYLKDKGCFKEDDEYYEAEDKSNFQCAYLIDDYIKNVEDFNGVGILIRRSWNNKYPYAISFSGLSEVADFLT